MLYHLLPRITLSKENPSEAAHRSGFRAVLRQGGEMWGCGWKSPKKSEFESEFDEF